MDWPIREFCRVPIYFGGRKYYVRSRTKAERPYAMVYELSVYLEPCESHDEFLARCPRVGPEKNGHSTEASIAIWGRNSTASFQVILGLKDAPVPF